MAEGALDPEPEVAPLFILRRADMPVFCQFYGFTPTEYRALTMRDWRRLRRYLIERLEAEASA